MFADWLPDNLIVFFLRTVARALRRIRTFFWRPTTARVTGSICLRAGFGCHIALIHYEYAVDGKTYRGIHREPFLRYAKGWLYARHYNVGSQFSIAVKPSRPASSVGRE